MADLWQVEIEVAERADFDPQNINGRIELFADALSLFDAVVGGTPIDPPDGMHRYNALLSIESDGPVDAHISAMAAFHRGAKKAGLPEFPVVRCEILTWEEFERRLDEPAFPELFGISEIADAVKVTRQRASQLARTESFPLPFAELASGPVWLEPNVRQFITEWSRKPGRPKNTSDVPTSSIREVNRMAKSRRTSVKSGKAASKVLRSKATGKNSKTAAASALSQRAPKRSKGK